jgi:hypothetical protein
MNAMGGTSRGFRVTPAAATDSPDAYIPGPEPTLETAAGKSEEGAAVGDGLVQSQARNGSTATGEGNPSKAESHERHRHETRPEGYREEQDVTRVRNPEGVAESGGGTLGGSHGWRRKQGHRRQSLLDTSCAVGSETS